MKIALVDDDRNCLDEMTKICRDFGLENHCRIETSSFTSGEAFLSAMESASFSLVFMDVYMSGIDGIAAALKMRKKGNMCLLVFLTSSPEFMPDAFSCHAFEYVTKPFTPQRITAVLHDALRLIKPSSRYLELSNGKKTIPLLHDNILSVITDAHYLNIELTDGTSLRSRMTMSDFLHQLDGDPRFIHVNKGIVLNADYILDFEDHCCILENGARFPIRVRDRVKTEQEVRSYHFDKIRRRQYSGKE